MYTSMNIYSYIYEARSYMLYVFLYVVVCGNLNFGDRLSAVAVNLHIRVDIYIYISKETDSRGRTVAEG